MEDGDGSFNLMNNFKTAGLCWSLKLVQKLKDGKWDIADSLNLVFSLSVETYNCGIFCSIYVDYIANDSKLNITQNDIV